MRFFLVMLALAGAMVGQAAAQTIDDMSIWVQGYEDRLVGGETTGVSLRTGPIVIGRAVAGFWSTWDCAYFSVSSQEGNFKDGSTADWTVELIPLRIVGRAVTFRLRWTRFTGHRGQFRAAQGDHELTLRAGESWTIDSVPVPAGAETFNGRPCDATAAILRVSVQNRENWDEPRLFGVDLWLVERAAGGAERSQPLSLRGLPHRPMPFYFDSIVDGTASLNVLGDVVASPSDGTIQLDLETISRLPDPPALSQVAPARWFKSSLRAAPNEVVEVALPKLDAAAGPFANRAFAIRIRVRQIR